MNAREGQPVDCGLQIADCGLEDAPTAQRSSGPASNAKSEISNLQFLPLLKRIHAADMPERADIEDVLRTDDPRALDLLFDFADGVRRRFVGQGVLLRGLIEFSNVCRNTCRYCGLNRHNHHLQRYRLTDEEILAAAGNVRRAGIKTIVLQSGEEDGLDADRLAGVIERIKQSFDVAVTLCLGERSRAEYEIWRRAGADRYLLKIETADTGLYGELHPGMSFENRVRCLRNLVELGYQTGSGNLVGLKGQTLASLAGDIQFFKRWDFDMVSVSPFLPHPQTPLATEPAGDLTTALKMTALARLVSPRAHIPASTAFGSLHGRDERPRALAAGANVLMPNFTPAPYRRYYEIYPNKRCVSEDGTVCAGCMEQMAAALGRRVDYSRGDRLSRGLLIDDKRANSKLSIVNRKGSDGEEGADDR
jgi:biotin synthase